MSPVNTVHVEGSACIFWKDKKLAVGTIKDFRSDMQSVLDTMVWLLVATKTSQRSFDHLLWKSFREKTYCGWNVDVVF